MPTSRLSTTRTGTGDSAAASRAAATVPDSSPEMWTERMPRAPLSAAAR